MPKIDLTMEESNLINYILKQNAERLFKEFDDQARLIDTNGSSDGAFGPTIMALDEQVLQNISKTALFYDNLAEKFPFSELDTSP